MSIPSFIYVFLLIISEIEIAKFMQKYSCLLVESKWEQIA